MMYRCSRAHGSVRRLAILAALVMLPRGLTAQRPVDLAPNAPRDKPTAADQCQWNVMLKATRPLVEHAQATLPAALNRFRNGLPRGQALFVTVRLDDTLGHHEQAFVAVDSVNESRLIGRIWNPMQSVRGYRLYQQHVLGTGDVVDWMISKPDGSEEGNDVGKFLDTYQPPAVCKDSSRAVGDLDAGLVLSDLFDLQGRSVVMGRWPPKSVAGPIRISS